MLGGRLFCPEGCRSLGGEGETEALLKGIDREGSLTAQRASPSLLNPRPSSVTLIERSEAGKRELPPIVRMGSQASEGESRGGKREERFEGYANHSIRLRCLRKEANNRSLEKKR